MINRLKTGDPALLAGVMGSMVGLYYTKRLCPVRGFCAAVGGTGAALFLSPAIASLFPTDFAPAVTFLTGIFAMSIIGVVFQVIEQIRAAPIKTIADIANIFIDVLLAFRNGVDRRNRRKDDPPFGRDDPADTDDSGPSLPAADDANPDREDENDGD